MLHVGHETQQFEQAQLEDDQQESRIGVLGHEDIEKPLVMPQQALEPFDTVNQ
jgi:hypothetical protein